MQVALATRDDPRGEPFGFVCARCLNCCSNKRIQVNPYEVARLARNRSLTASEFRAQCTIDGEGAYLKQRDSGACVFLGPQGCDVHADRPLVCRLYPLGRHVTENGAERFTRLTTHPLSKGEITSSSTIAAYLEDQDAAPFIRAADEYYFWLLDAADQLETELSEYLAPTSTADTEDAWALLDMDRCVERHCASNGISAPGEIEARKTLHLAVLYASLPSKEEGTANDR